MCVYVAIASATSECHPCLASGVYVPSTRQDVPKWFRGTGIRIEDDVLITADGYRNLTTCPKSVKEIEEAASRM